MAGELREWLRRRASWNPQPGKTAPRGTIASDSPSRTLAPFPRETKFFPSQAYGNPKLGGVEGVVLSASSSSRAFPIRLAAAEPSMQRQP